MSNRAIVADRQRGLIDVFFRVVFAIIVGLAISLFLSIVIEWIGIRFFWREQGARHSLSMLTAELSYLSGELDRNLFTRSSREFAESISNTIVDWIWFKTYAIEIVRWLSEPPSSNASTMRLVLHDFNEYAQASVTMTQVFGVRLTTLLLASPLFFLVSLIAIADGFVERDLRKWGGGRESGYTFHIAKRFIGPTITLFVLALLSAPVSVHPMSMMLPAVLMLGLAMRLTTASFKKYL